MPDGYIVASLQNDSLSSGGPGAACLRAGEGPEGDKRIFGHAKLKAPSYIYLEISMDREQIFEVENGGSTLMRVLENRQLPEMTLSVLMSVSCVRGRWQCLNLEAPHVHVTK